MSDWREYYSKAKARERRKKNYDPVKQREYHQKYKEERPEQWLESRRKSYAKWLSKPENKAKKKAYQKDWYQRVKKKSEQEQRQEMYKVRDILREGKPYVVGDNCAEMRIDKAGNFFFFIRKSGKLSFISDKFEDENKAVKKLMEAVL